MYPPPPPSPSASAHPPTRPPFPAHPLTGDAPRNFTPHAIGSPMSVMAAKSLAGVDLPETSPRADSKAPRARDGAEPSTTADSVTPTCGGGAGAGNVNGNRNGKGVGHREEQAGVEARRFMSAAVSGLLHLHDDPRPFAGLCLAFAGAGSRDAASSSLVGMKNGGGGSGGGGEGTAAEKTCRGDDFFFFSSFPGRGRVRVGMICCAGEGVSYPKRWGQWWTLSLFF